MLKPICVACARFYRPHKTGRLFVEGMPKDGVSGAVPGKDYPGDWQPYKVWVGDEWKCHGCGHLIIVGCAGAPLREHYQPDFDKALALATYLQVNDC